MTPTAWRMCPAVSTDVLLLWLADSVLDVARCRMYVPTSSSPERARMRVLGLIALGIFVAPYLSIDGARSIVPSSPALPSAATPTPPPIQPMAAVVPATPTSPAFTAGASATPDPNASPAPSAFDL